ncbi:MAG: CcmD family protein [Acidobacteria bacterium]|nr:CcmD family protein [Acidobacteriota bacterium]
MRRAVATGVLLQSPHALSDSPAPAADGEPLMDTRNFTFMFYGFLAAWAILMVYVLSLGARERKLRQELRRVREMLEAKKGRG